MLEFIKIVHNFSYVVTLTIQQIQPEKREQDESPHLQ